MDGGRLVGFGADPPPLDNVIEFFAERIRKQTPLFGIWVAIGDHQILGWQAMQPCRNNPISADRSAESSTYVADGHKGKGVGKALIAFALEHARRTNMLYVQGIIGANNLASIKIVEAAGFTRVGILPTASATEPTFFFYAYTLGSLSGAIEPVPGGDSTTDSEQIDLQGAREAQ